MLSGWASEPIEDWALYFNSYFTDCTDSTLLQVQLEDAQLNNGRTTKLSVSVPTGTPTTAVGVVTVFSMRSDLDYHATPILVRVRPH
jgi:hypothetical protein